MQRPSSLSNQFFALLFGIMFLQEELSPQITIGFILVFDAVVVSETGSAVIEKEAGSESQPD